ncbi:dihydrofolate reductase family protein [Saccharomonospora sp. NPDC006951]
MSKVTCGIAMSVDGFVAGPNQTRDNPLGEIVGDRLHTWMFEEPEAHAAEIAKLTSAGAYIMGRNMFGPIRGEWSTEEEWTGWWGEEPPYHGPVFVLTHHPREPLPMKGGTTFHFVTGGIEAALAEAKAAAGDRDISIAGGASTVNQYLAAGVIDELDLYIAPVLVGEGERLFAGVGDLDLEPTHVRATDLVTHISYRFPRR